MKNRITVTLDEDLLEWLDHKIDERIFANRSHGLEFLINKKMDDEKEAKKK